MNIICETIDQVVRFETTSSLKTYCSSAWRFKILMDSSKVWFGIIELRTLNVEFALYYQHSSQMSLSFFTTKQRLTKQTINKQIKIIYWVPCPKRKKTKYLIWDHSALRPSLRPILLGCVNTILIFIIKYIGLLPKTV